MRNHNGYGGIVDLGKNRRKRYAVRVTNNYTSSILSPGGTFKQKYKYIGYYATAKETKKALAEYNENFTPTKYIDITFTEVWELWSLRNLTDETTSRYRSYSAAYNKCRPLYNLRMTDIKLNNLQTLIDNCSGLSKSTINNIKIVMNFIFLWALKNDVVKKNYVDFIELPDAKEVQNHKRFTANDVAHLWDNTSLYMPVLMYIYTGVRPAELISLKKSDVNIPRQYFDITKSKTAAGIRTVPIADKVLSFFKHYMSTTPGERLVPFTYKELLNFYREHLKTHTPHDTRSTFVLLLTEANVSETVIQKIVGHSSNSVTRKVYTQLDITALLDAVNKI